jgi:hypothetical protein
MPIRGLAKARELKAQLGVYELLADSQLDVDIALPAASWH